MEILMRNLLNVYCRYKWATVLNLVGLSLAFTSCYIITKQVWYEFNFNRALSDHERIYRFEQFSSTKVVYSFVRPLLLQIFENSPYIENAGMKYFAVDPILLMPEENISGKLFQKNVSRIDKGFTEVFGFKWIDGNPGEFDRASDNIIVPASMALEIFGSEQAAGKVLVIKNEKGASTGRYKIVAVYRDFPDNTSVSNYIYTGLGDFEKDSWGDANYYAFIKVAPSADIESIVQSVRYPEGYFEQWSFFVGKDFKVRLFPLDDVYFNSSQSSSIVGMPPTTGSLDITYLFIGIGSLILAIAAINFINFSMALAPIRIKSFNTQKVLGASVFSLRRSYLLESGSMSLFAFMISLIEIQLLNYSSLTNLFPIDISISSGVAVLLICAGIAVLLGILAGLWPAFYITSIPAIVALKGSFNLSPKGIRIRNILIGFQFFITLVLFVIASFFALQNRFMLTSPLGFEKKGLVTIQCGMFWQYTDVLVNQMKTYAGGESVFTAGNLLLGRYQGWGESKSDFVCQVFITQPEFTKALGIEITEGRDFKPGEYKKVLINESARKNKNFKLGDEYRGYEIIGFIPDIKIFPMRVSSSVPFGIFSDSYNSVVYMKLKPGVDEQEAVDYCRKLADSLTPLPGLIQVSTMNDIVEDVYQKEHDQFLIIALFCVLTMFIAVMGVFGLVIFETQSRRKEIAIRKINGAYTRTIIWLFNRTYLSIVLICFVVSVPVSWFIVHSWLDGFVYRIPIYSWVFILALGVVLFITTVTVSLQCWRTANANPVESVKNE